MAIVIFIELVNDLGMTNNYNIYMHDHCAKRPISMPRLVFLIIQSVASWSTKSLIYFDSMIFFFVFFYH